MGRHSSDSENDHHKKKKKKRRSRSRSRGLDSDSGSYSSSKHKKSKKSKKSRRSRSRSRGRHSRSRSRSRDRHRGSRRSRSRDRRRSRSVSKSRTYRSRSSSRTRSRRASVSPLRARSRRSRSRDRRSRSRSRTRKNRSRSGSPAHSKKVKEEQDSGLRDSVPGFDKMTPIEQAEVRMNLALKAAAAADQQLKEQGVFGGTSRGAFELSLDDQHKRVTAIEDIESDGFAQQAFTSNRVKSENNGSVVSPNPHLSGINGTGIVNATYSRAPIDDPNSVIHPSLYVSKEEKILRWKKKLITMRKRKLEGEAMS